MTDLDKRIDRHASLMQVNHAIGNFALAMRHCRIFTTLARRRAAPLFNDGTGAPGLRIPCRASTPSPYQDKECAGRSATRKNT